MLSEQQRNILNPKSHTKITRTEAVQRFLKMDHFSVMMLVFLLDIAQRTIKRRQKADEMEGKLYYFECESTVYFVLFYQTPTCILTSIRCDAKETLTIQWLVERRAERFLKITFQHSATRFLYSVQILFFQGKKMYVVGGWYFCIHCCRVGMDDVFAFLFKRLFS